MNGVMPELQTNVKSASGVGNLSNPTPSPSSSAIGGLTSMTGLDSSTSDLSNSVSGFELPKMDNMTGLSKYLQMVGMSEDDISTFKTEFSKFFSGDSKDIQFNLKKYTGDWDEADSEYLASVGKASSLYPTSAENMSQIAGSLEEDTSAITALQNFTMGMMAIPTQIPPARSSSQDYSTGGGFNRYTAPMITRCTDSSIRRVADAFMAYGMP